MSIICLTGPQRGTTKEKKRKIPALFVNAAKIDHVSENQNKMNVTKKQTKKKWNYKALNKYTRGEI